MTMQIEVNINPDDVNKQVTEAIIRSALGEKLSKAIATALNEALEGNGYNRRSIVEDVVREHIRMAVSEVVHEPETYEKIKMLTRKMLETTLADATMERFFKRLQDRLFD
jgi:uncharacterized membrane-anchored protein YjiN (DUF445 family)